MPKRQQKITSYVKMSFDEAKRRYVHRFTMDHVPAWAVEVNIGNGKYYAPQYRSDEEWYANTSFPPSPNCWGSDSHSINQTWPLGQWLDAPFSRR